MNKEELKKMIIDMIDEDNYSINGLIEENNDLKFAMRTIANILNDAVSDEKSRKKFYDQLSLKYSSLESERIIFEFCVVMDQIKDSVDVDIFEEFFKFDVEDDKWIK